jgi:membrane fusion protein
VRRQQEAQSAQHQQLLAERSARQLDLSSRQHSVITAPVSGRIAMLPVVAGQALARDNVVAVIVPGSGRMMLELHVPAKAAGLLQRHQDVQIYYDAFPFQRFGSGKGKIVSISETLVPSGDLAFAARTLQEPVFRVRATIEDEAIRAYGRRVGIQPGMTVQVDIVTSRRSMFEWLFDPIFAAMERSL